MSAERMIDKLPPANRTKPMEVLALGFSRTGTISLKVALEKLEYRVYHGSVAVRRWEKKHLHLWDEALKAKLLGEGKPWTGDDIDKLLPNYTAIEDIPCILFIDELLEKFPDAKVILTNRDVDSWEKSMQSSIFKIMKWKSLPFIARLDPPLWGPYYSMMTIIANKWTDGDINNSSALRRTYLNHYAEVRAKVPKYRLLEFESKDGWEPLCEFLGKSAPKDEPYPRVNDGNWLVKAHTFIYYYRLWACLKRYVGAAVLVGAVGVGYWKLTG